MFEPDNTFQKAIPLKYSFTNNCGYKLHMRKAGQLNAMSEFLGENRLIRFAHEQRQDKEDTTYESTSADGKRNGSR